MFTHLRYRSARVEARSPAGELAARVLMLNDEQSVRYREDLLSIIATLEEKARRVQDTMRITQRLVLHPEQAGQLTEAKIAAEEDLAKLKQLLIRIAGAAFTG